MHSYDGYAQYLLLFINYGISQSKSVLGLILFNLYIDSVCSLDINGPIVTYANDTCPLFSGDSWNEVCINTAKEFKKVIIIGNYQ